MTRKTQASPRWALAPALPREGRPAFRLRSAAPDDANALPPSADPRDDARNLRGALGVLRPAGESVLLLPDPAQAAAIGAWLALCDDDAIERLGDRLPTVLIAPQLDAPTDRPAPPDTAVRTPSDAGADPTLPATATVATGSDNAATPAILPAASWSDAPPAAPRGLPPWPKALTRFRNEVVQHGPGHAVTRAAHDTLAQVAARNGISPDALTAAIDEILEFERELRVMKRLAWTHGNHDPEARRARDRLYAAFPSCRGIIGFHWATIRSRTTDAEGNRVAPIHRSSVEPSRHDHLIHRLPPSRDWIIAVDESGDFQQRGQLVAIVFPDMAAWAGLPDRHHATEVPEAVNDRIMQIILDAPVGVFGLLAAEGPPGGEDRYLATLHDVLATVIRLLPIEEGRDTRVTVLVEQRGSLTPAQPLRLVLSETFRQLRAGDPDRMARVTLDGDVLGKGEHPALVAPDVVSHAWFGAAKVTRSRIGASGLTDHCLVSLPSNKVASLFERVEKGLGPSGEEWEHLLATGGPKGPPEVIRVALNRLAERCRGDRALWTRYVRVVLEHLDSKAIRLDVLQRQIDWLDACHPEGTTLPARLDLVWTTARIEEFNHTGHFGDSDDELPALVAHLDALTERLVDECPDLVCQADLVRAVSATNRFDFDRAARLLDPWDAVDPRIPGRLHWGRLLSSFGQHAAFRGDSDTAEAHFAAAIEVFRKLADPDDAAREISQTAAYRAINAMDARRPDVRQRLVEAGVPLDPDGVRRICTAPTPAQRFTHHILLRHLATGADPELAQVCLDARNKWATDAGHPWPLIELYRHLLAHTRDPKVAARAIRRAHATAFDEAQGPTVRFIGHVIQTIAGRHGVDLPSPEDDRDDRAALPLAPWDVLDRAHTFSDARALLRAALPFNFR